MPTSPDPGTGPLSSGRELTARRLLAYLERFPMGTEERLELALDVLRTLPADATPDQALAALWPRLPQMAPDVFPPAHPRIQRGHMPAQYLGRPRTGLTGFAARWGWLLFVPLLLALTLLVNNLP